MKCVRNPKHSMRVGQGGRWEAAIGAESSTVARVYRRLVPYAGSFGQNVEDSNRLGFRYNTLDRIYRINRVRLIQAGQIRSNQEMP